MQLVNYYRIIGTNGLVTGGTIEHVHELKFHFNDFTDRFYSYNDFTR